MSGEVRMLRDDPGDGASTPTPSPANELRQAAETLRERAGAATPGPWETGDRWHIQGAGFCPCKPEWGPAVKARREINGERMDSHAHRIHANWWPHGVFTRDLQSDGFSHNVANDTDEYGYMTDADADWIVTMHPGVGLALADLLDALAEAHIHAPDSDAAMSVYALPGMDGSPQVRLARLINGGAS